MRNSFYHFLWIALIASLGSGGCHDSKPDAAGSPAGNAQQVEAKAEPDGGIPPDRLDAILREHYRGVEFIERYDYEHAAEAFPKVHELAPQWIPGSINLAIALMHQSGPRRNDPGLPGEGDRRIEALDLLNDVILRDPKNPHARYCRGLMFVGLDATKKAHADFQVVVEQGPSDANAWYMLGATVQPDLNNARQLDEQIADFRKALECNPYLAAAVYMLALASRLSGDRDATRTLLDHWRQLDGGPSGIRYGDEAGGSIWYGDPGRYAWVINPLTDQKPPSSPIRPPCFDRPDPVKVKLWKGDR